MSDPIYELLNSALAKEIQLDVLANNIANVNTIGYKADRVFTLPEDVTATDIELPRRQKHSAYVRRPIPSDCVVPEVF